MDTIQFNAPDSRTDQINKSKLIIIGLLVFLLITGFVYTFLKQETGSSGNIYKNDKYNFSLRYPSEWQIDENNNLGGPGFRPANLNLQSIQSGKFNKNKDCFFNIAFLSASQNKTIPCKNTLGDVMLGSNKFTRCGFSDGEIKYMLLHPKTGNIISFSYLNNPTCQSIFENSLSSLGFK